MIEINPSNKYNDEEFDSCGNLAMAVLKIDNIKIPLCNRCINELNESLSEFNNTVFCYKCKHFIMSSSGWRYGGSCRKDKEIKLRDAGYINCVDCMDTCKDAVLNPKNGGGPVE